MRIAFAYDLPYPWHIGGIEQINATEAEELAKANEVHFFTMRWPNMPSTTVRNGVNYHAWYPASINTVYRHGRRSIRKALAFSFGLLRLFGYRFDLLVIDQFPYLHIPIAVVYAKLTGCKLVIRVAEVWSLDYWKSYLGVLGAPAHSLAISLSKMGDHYIANSQKTMQQLEQIGVKRSKIKVFAPVLNKEALDFALKSSHTKRRRVVFSGRLIKEKRIDAWIRAVGKASKLDSRINGTIIGKGAEEASLKKLVKDLKLDHVVSFKRFFKSKSSLYKYIAESSVLLNMSSREGLSIITLEAIALGTRVLLPSDSPIPEDIKEMCTVAEESAIPMALKRICSNPEQKRERIQSLERYYSSNVVSFYSALTKEMGL